MKQVDDTKEYTTNKSVREIANGLRSAADKLRANVESIESGNDPLAVGPQASYDIEVVLSGRVGFFGGMKHYRPGGANNIWAVQVYVKDRGPDRLVTMIALGEKGLGAIANGIGVLNLGSSKDKRDVIEKYIL